MKYAVKQSTLIFTINRATQGRCPPSAAKNSGVFLSTSTSEQWKVRLQSIYQSNIIMLLLYSIYNKCKLPF